MQVPSNPTGKAGAMSLGKVPGLLCQMPVLHRIISQAGCNHTMLPSRLQSHHAGNMTMEQC